MENIKYIIGLIAAGLVLVGYIPYIRDIIKGRTKPHIFSWGLWGIVTGIAFSLQVSANAGAGSFVTLTAALMCLVVLGLGLKQGKKNIKPIDGLFLLLALISLALWLVAKQPILSIILVTLIDVFGFLPTVRKSIDDPYSETLSFYWINTFRFGLAIIALREYTIITALYPISWSLINFIFALFLFSARKKIAINQVEA